MSVMGNPIELQIQANRELKHCHKLVPEKFFSTDFDVAEQNFMLDEQTRYTGGGFSCAFFLLKQIIYEITGTRAPFNRS